METKYFTIHQLQEAGELIRKGKLVAFPTETVYGLGGNALDPSAAKAIYRAKGRPSDNPLIVHIGSRDQLAQIVSSLDPVSEILADAFWPGPLTLILPKHSQVPDQTSGGLATLGVRIPDDPLALEFLKVAQVPVAAPSANLSGRPSPTSFSMVKRDLDGRIDGIIQGSDTRIGLESTILWVADQKIHILRPGAIGKKEIQEAIDAKGLGDLEIVPQSSLGKDSRKVPSQPAAPGTRYRHYSPKAQIRVYQSGIEWFKDPEFLGTLAQQGSGLVELRDSRSGPPIDHDELRRNLKHNFGVTMNLLDLQSMQSLPSIESYPSSLANQQRLSPRLFLLPIESLEQYAQEFYRSLVGFDELGVETIFMPLPRNDLELPRQSYQTQGGLVDALTDRILRAAGLTTLS